MKGNAIVQQIRHGKKSQTESAVTSAIKAHVLRRLSEEKKRLVAEHFADLDEGCSCEDDDDLEEDCDDEDDREIDEDHPPRKPGWKLQESTYTVLKTINSHRGYGQFIMELPEEPEGWIPRVKAIPSPYAYSPTDAVYIWKGKKVITRETSHKKYQVFEVPGDVHIYDNEHDAETHHVNQK